MDTTSSEAPSGPSGESDRRSPRRLAHLTGLYARYSRSAGGLASVLAGVLALVAYGVGAFAPPDAVGGRLALAATPFLWIMGKELLRTRYYQRLGRVRQLISDHERWWHLGFTAFTALVSAGVVAVALWGMASGASARPTLASFGYLIMVALMPFLVWHFMKTPLEFIVGVFLVCQGALMLAGSHYALGEQVQAPIAAVVLLGVGLRQHLEFRELEQKIEDMGGVA